MDATAIHACTAFAGTRRLAGGPVRDVALAVKAHLDAHPDAQVLVFDNATAQPVEFDLRGTLDDVLARLDRTNKLVVLVPAAFAISAFIGPELAGRLAAANGFAPLFALAIGCAAIPALTYWLFADRMTTIGDARAT